MGFERGQGFDLKASWGRRRRCKTPGLAKIPGELELARPNPTKILAGFGFGLSVGVKTFAGGIRDCDRLALFEHVESDIGMLGGGTPAVGDAIDLAGIDRRPSTCPASRLRARRTPPRRTARY